MSACGLRAQAPVLLAAVFKFCHHRMRPFLASFPSTASSGAGTGDGVRWHSPPSSSAIPFCNFPLAGRRPHEQAHRNGVLRHREPRSAARSSRAAFASVLLWPVLLFTGAASAGIYTVALSELGDRFLTGTELVSGTASFATMWGAGALAGALIAGWAFQNLRARRTPLCGLALFAIFIAGMTTARLARTAR